MMTLRRVLSILLCLVAGITAFWIVSTDVRHLVIEKRTEKEELVFNRPSVQATLTKDTAFSQNGAEVGRIKQGTVVYLTAPPIDADPAISAYGWIWAKSVSTQDGWIQLKADENVRYRANSGVIARLQRSAHGRQLHVNDTGSWYLVRLDGNVPRSNLQVLSSTSKTFLDRLKEPRRVLSVTSRNGGIPYTYNLIEPTFMLIMSLVFVVLGAARIVVSDPTVRTSITVEAIKAVVQVVVGVVLGFLIFGLGLKS